MDDSPIDIDDDIYLDSTSSDISDGPDLDDEYALSTTQEVHYVYFPKTQDEFKEIVKMEVEKQGGVNVNLNMIDTSKITHMISIFYNCKQYESLQTIDVSRWDVANVSEGYEFYVQWL